MKYRSEIDGLRAIAVLAVVLEHAGFRFLSGGYIGVDIFFVISGYLITTHILSDLDAGRFSFFNFYLRRLRRLLPALYVTLAVTVPLSWALLMPEEFELFAKSLIGSVVYVANFVFWQSTNYFSPSVEEMPLIHIWSLAVEEQFYLFFPLAAFLFYRFMRRHLFVAFVLISIVSLLLADFGSRYHPVANFYLLPTRIWEFGVGALCAMAILRGFRAERDWSLAGLAAIFAALVAFDHTTRHPSFLSLLPVLGTALVILSTNPGHLANRLLSLPPVVFVGLVSYSLYLWHQPVFAFARIRYGLHEPVEFILPILLAFGLSVMSWRYVEQPFRHNRSLMQPRVFGNIAVSFGFVLVGIGLIFMTNRMIQTRVPAEVLAFLKDQQRSARSESCHWEPGRTMQKILETCVFGKGQGRILVTGDSHAGTLVSAFEQAMATRSDLSVTSLHAVGCAPARGLHRIDGNSPNCHMLMDALLTEKTLAPFSTVVMVGRWSLYYEGSGFDNGEGGIENTLFAPVDTRPSRISRFPMADDEQRKARVGKAIRDQIQALLGMGKTVILVEAVPEVGWNVTTHAARNLLFHGNLPKSLSTSQAVYKARVRGYQTEIEAIKHPQFVRVPTGDLFCNLPAAAGRCIAIEDGKPLYSDSNHLNQLGARRLVDLVLAIREQARKGNF